MSDALSAVLDLVSKRNAQQQQQTDNLNSGITLLNQQMQNAKQNQLLQLQIKAGLAQSGLQLNPDNSIQYNQNLIPPYQQLTQRLGVLTAAKNAGQQNLYQQLTNQANGLMANSQTPQQPQGSPQVAALLAAAPAQGISPNVSPQPPTSLNGMLTLGQNSTTDPYGGVTTTSQNQVNLPAKSIETIEGAKDAALGAGNTQYAQDLSQLGLEAGQLAQINKLHQNLSNAKLAGYPGATLASSVGKLAASPQIQSDLGQLNSSIEGYGKSALIASTSEPGVGGAKRGGTSSQLLQQDTPHSELEGNIKGLLWNGYEKTLATNKYNALLSSQGQNPANQTPQQKQAGVYAQMGQMTDSERKIGQNLIDRTLYTGPTAFKSEAAALNANVPSGTIVTINGRRARIN